MSTSFPLYLWWLKATLKVVFNIMSSMTVEKTWICSFGYVVPLYVGNQRSFHQRSYASVSKSRERAFEFGSTNTITLGFDFYKCGGNSSDLHRCANPSTEVVVNGVPIDKNDILSCNWLWLSCKLFVVCISWFFIVGSAMVRRDTLLVTIQIKFSFPSLITRTTTPTNWFAVVHPSTTLQATLLVLWIALAPWSSYLVGS